MGKMFVVKKGEAEAAAVHRKELLTTSQAAESAYVSIPTNLSLNLTVENSI